MSEQRSGPDFDPDLGKGQGHVPAVNRDRDTAADAQPAPGNVQYDVPVAETAETLEGGVRRESAQSGEPARLPSDD